MIGILVATHGELASGLIDAGKLIIGDLENVDFISLHEGEIMDVFRNTFEKKIRSLDNGKGVMVLVDVQNATPFNVAGSLISRLQEDGINIRVVTGVNLPILLETNFIRHNHETVDELYSEIISIGKDSIVELKEMVGI